MLLWIIMNYKYGYKSFSWPTDGDKDKFVCGFPAAKTTTDNFDSSLYLINYLNNTMSNASWTEAMLLLMSN